ncbi:protein of unknown function [Paraburkholderia kururiensis]
MAVPNHRSVIAQARRPALPAVFVSLALRVRIEIHRIGHFDHEVRLRNSHARQDVALRLFFSRKTRPLDRMAHRALDHAAQARAAGAVAARTWQPQIREAGGFEHGERIGRLEGAAQRFDANAWDHRVATLVRRGVRRGGMGAHVCARGTVCVMRTHGLLHIVAVQ